MNSKSKQRRLICLAVFAALVGFCIVDSWARPTSKLKRLLLNVREDEWSIWVNLQGDDYHSVIGILPSEAKLSDCAAIFKLTDHFEAPFPDSTGKWIHDLTVNLDHATAIDEFYHRWVHQGTESGYELLARAGQKVYYEYRTW